MCRYGAHTVICSPGWSANPDTSGSSSVAASVNSFVGRLFGHASVHPLKLRYFNPTQSWIEDRVAKGLVEARDQLRVGVRVVHQSFICSVSAFDRSFAVTSTIGITRS